MSYFIKTINSALVNKNTNPLLVNLFFNKNSNIKKYVIGKNEESACLIKTIKIDGVIDDYQKNDNLWNGIPVIKTEHADKNSIVVNCSTSISPVSVQKHLESNNFKHIITISDLINSTQSLLIKPWFVEQMQNHFYGNINHWNELYDLLQDDISKTTLIDVLRFRLTANPEYMKNYKIRFHEQYFEDFLNISKEFFVDAGGYNGDTTEIFCTNYSNYKKILFFEPSPDNLKLAKIRLANFENITFSENGLSDKSEVLNLDTTAGSASAIKNSTDNTTPINVIALDDYTQETVTFIKMDIEGWELKALLGCKNHILNNKPKLAIAVYHNAGDFVDIKNFILSLNRNYKIYLRHYTEGWSETIMYFVL